jgi:phage gp36-like protein
VPYPLIEQAQLEARVGRVTVQRVLDDDNVGEADPEAVSRILKDASSKVLGGIRGNYPVDEIKAMASEQMPEELVRVTLDQAVAMLAQRYPEVMQRDWVALMKQADSDLKELRLAKRGLDTDGAPEPPKNAQATLVASIANPRVWGCGFGSF